jgi:exopolysaccharide biosynthesis polyprenyl glycosylphosphotransferase
MSAAGVGQGEKWGAEVNVRATLNGGDGQAAEAILDASVVGADVVNRQSVRDDRPKSSAQRGRLRRRALMAADLAALLTACALVSFVTAAVQTASALEALLAALFLAAVLLSLWTGLATIYGLYRREEQRADLTTTDDIVPVVVLLSLASWVTLVVATLTGTTMPMSLVVGLWASAVVLVVAGRTVVRGLRQQWPKCVENTLIVGAGDIGQLLGRKLAQHPELGLKLVGFADDDPKAMRQDLTDIPVLGGPNDLAALVREHDIHRIVIAFSNEPHYRQLELVHTLRSLDVQIDLVPRLFEAIGPAVNVHYIEGLPLVALPSARATGFARAGKRTIDIVGSALILAVLSPLFLHIAWRVRRGSTGPVFFRQERLGENMKPFELLKFRTMEVDTDDAPHREYMRSIMDTSQTPTANNLYKLDRGDAVTKVGAWLRRTSLDELPQLINVLRGDMSLVGPRPCMAYESELFEPHHFDRFLVPAGMTGLWQVTARARTTFKEALDLDAAYARDWNLRLDLKLMMRTPAAVLRARGTA